MKKSKNQKSPKAFGDLKNCISITFRLAAQVYQNKKFGFEIENEEVPTTYILLSLGYGWEKRRAAIEMEVQYYTTFLQFLIRLFGPGRIEVVIIHGPRSSVRLRPFRRRRRRYRVAGVSSAIGQPASALWNFLCVPGKTLSASFNRQVDQNTASEYILPSILLKEKSISQ